MRAFTLRTEQVRESLLQFVRECPLEPPMRFVIKEYRKDKTLEQLGYIWGVVLPTMRKHVLDSTGDHYTDKNIYNAMIDAYAPTQVEKFMGRNVVSKKTLSDMNVKETSEFIECIIQHAAMHMDLVIPEAEPQ